MQTLIGVKRILVASGKIVLSMLLATGFMNNAAYADSKAPPKSPVTNSVVNPNAEEDINDPLVDWSVYVPPSELGAKADEIMDRFVVTADRWVNPSIDGIRDILRLAPNAYGVFDPRSPEGRSERQRVCNNLKSLSNALKCNSARNGPPDSFYDFNIDTVYYSTWALWQDVVTRFGQSVFANQLPASPNVYRNPLDLFTEAFRESVSRCNTETRCIRQVYQFFGATSISLPDLPYIGNINDYVNDYLRVTPFANSLPNSAAGIIMQQYGNSTICQRLADDQRQKGCKP
jgi:hypothetical protein